MVRRLLILALLAFSAFADEDDAAKRLESVRKDPLMLRRFLEQMPKGGDLHQHLSGTVYAETFIELAAQDGLCIDTDALAYEDCSAEGPHVPAAQAQKDSRLYTKMLDAMSMRQFRPAMESGHDRFFATFGRFGAVTRGHISEMLTEVVSRFARENVDYIESLFSQDGGASRELGAKVKAGASYEEMRTQLLANGVAETVALARKNIDDAEAHLNRTLGCSSATPQPGCASTVRYLYETHRGFAREALFAELLVGFELVNADRRVVGLNTVQPEDSRASMTGFEELMKMLEYLRPLYPHVPVTLHAGELAGGLVPPEGMQHHIRDSVLRAGAERIGHGVDIARERDALDLLDTMRERSVAVEVCLTSNDVILGVKGRQHPLRLYMRRGVPVVLATDDAGVARSDMTTEWQRAVEEHAASYKELKRFARNSIEYSFLEGESLFNDHDYESVVSACEDDDEADECTAFLEANPRARVQMRLEQRLKEFEGEDIR